MRKVLSLSSKLMKPKIFKNIKREQADKNSLKKHKNVSLKF